jgi:hypothetical protein
MQPDTKDVFRKNFVNLSDEDKERILAIKYMADTLYSAFNVIGPNREVSIARTKLEESIMWAIKGLTDKYYE